MMDLIKPWPVRFLAHDIEVIWSNLNAAKWYTWQSFAVDVVDPV